MSNETTPKFFTQIPGYLKGIGLNSTDKLIYGTIYTMLNVTGKCFMSNARIADAVETKIGTVKNSLTKMKKMGLINTTRTYKPGSKEVDKRFITINDDPVTNKCVPPSQINDDPVTNKLHPRHLYGKDNRLINKSINKSVESLSRSSATQSGKKEKSKTKLQSSYEQWTAKTNQQLTDLAMHYTKTRVANEQNELAYFNTLMEDWQSHNFKTVTEVKDYLSSKNGSRSKQPKSNVIQPEWLSDDYVEPEPPKPTEADRARVKEMLKKFD